jgi:hypothetical protein
MSAARCPEMNSMAGHLPVPKSYVLIFIIIRLSHSVIPQNRDYYLANAATSEGKLVGKIRMIVRGVGEEVFLLPDLCVELRAPLAGNISGARCGRGRQSA